MELYIRKERIVILFETRLPQSPDPLEEPLASESNYKCSYNNHSSRLKLHKRNDFYALASLGIIFPLHQDSGKSQTKPVNLSDEVSNKSY